MLSPFLMLARMSAGQKRRVGLARLFVESCPLWILDEPFTAIDRQGVAELEGWAHRVGLARLKQQMAELFPDVAPLLAGLSDAAQLREARYADVWMQRWHDGRVLAIGDCAHGMSPQLGQGANMALIDAHELSAEVGGDWAQVFERYSRRRRAHLRFYSQASRGLTPMFQSHAVIAPWLRDRFFGWGGKLPYIHQQSIATLAGYKTGWLWGRLKL